MVLHVHVLLLALPAPGPPDGSLAPRVITQYPSHGFGFVPQPAEPVERQVSEDANTFDPSSLRPPAPLVSAFQPLPPSARRRPPIPHWAEATARPFPALFAPTFRDNIRHHLPLYVDAAKYRHESERRHRPSP